MTTKNLLSKIIIFTVGAALGSAVTYKVVETKCKKAAQEEIESVREFYGAVSPDPKEHADEDEEEDEQIADAPDEYYEKKPTEREIYSSVLKAAGYAEEEEDEDMDKPYVISPEEFGEEGYVEISLTYHADGIVTNDRNKIIKNVDELIGVGSLEHFGEYEEDSVFVRNDRLKIDYEILKDYGEFSEIS